MKLPTKTTPRGSNDSSIDYKRSKAKSALGVAIKSKVEMINKKYAEIKATTKINATIAGTTTKSINASLVGTTKPNTTITATKGASIMLNKVIQQSLRAFNTAKK